SESPIQRAAFEGDRRGQVQQIQHETTGDSPYATEPLFPQTTPGGVSNQETAQRIAEAVQSTGLNNYDLEIRFADGVCTLRGAVDNKAQAISATEAAAKVSGVKTVLNQLTVKGHPVSVAPRGSGPTEPVASYQPYPSAQAASIAYQQQMQQQMARGGQAQSPVRTVSATGQPQMAPPQGYGPPPGYG